MSWLESKNSNRNRGPKGAYCDCEALYWARKNKQIKGNARTDIIILYALILNKRTPIKRKENLDWPNQSCKGTKPNKVLFCFMSTPAITPSCAPKKLDTSLPCTAMRCSPHTFSLVWCGGAHLSLYLSTCTRTCSNHKKQRKYFGHMHWKAVYLRSQYWLLINARLAL